MDHDYDEIPGRSRVRPVAPAAGSDGFTDGFGDP
jgi:hypothetical protein